MICCVKESAYLGGKMTSSFLNFKSAPGAYYAEYGITDMGSFVESQIQLMAQPSVIKVPNKTIQVNFDASLKSYPRIFTT